MVALVGSLHPDVWIAAVGAWDAGHQERVAAYDEAAARKDAKATEAAARALAAWNESFSQFIHFENNPSWSCYDVHEPLNRADFRVQYALALANAWAAKVPARALAGLPYSPDMVQWQWADPASDLVDPKAIAIACELRD